MLTIWEGLLTTSVSSEADNLSSAPKHNNPINNCQKMYVQRVSDPWAHWNPRIVKVFVFYVFISHVYVE